jgi:hypothetical protein
MHVLREGHRYFLANFENPKNDGQVIQFIEKEPIEEGSKELKTKFDGTTNEELLAVLLDRTTYLNSKFPCRENDIALAHLRDALKAFNDRTKSRIARNVEGKLEK